MALLTIPASAAAVRDLLLSFGKVGVFGFGEGSSMVPLIPEEMVDLRAWLSKEESLDAFAFGNALLWPLAALAFLLAVRYGTHPAALIIAGGTLSLLVFR